MVCILGKPGRVPQKRGLHERHLSELEPVKYLVPDAPLSIDQMPGPNSSPDSTVVTCLHSCGVCSHQCRDTEEACANWAKHGHRTFHSIYILKACPTSCGLCMARCLDRDDSCIAWSRQGECERSPEFMRPQLSAAMRRHEIVCRLAQRLSGHYRVSPSGNRKR